MLTAEQAERLIADFPGAGTTAPAWLPQPILRLWVTFPQSLDLFRSGLDRARGDDLLALIRAGAPMLRNRKTVLVPGSPLAASLANIVRVNDHLCQQLLRSVFAHYRGQWTPEQLVALAADPLEFYADSDQPPDLVVVLALALEVDEAVLEEIATDCASLLGSQKVDPRAKDRQQIEMLKAEASALRRLAKDAEKARVTAQRDRDSAVKQVEVLREAQEQGADADAARQQRLRDDLAAAQARAAKLTDDSGRAGQLEEQVAELEAQVEAMQDAQELLAASTGAADVQRRLREQAEKDAERNLNRVRELTAKLDSARDLSNLPIDDPASLMRALSRPVGQAARHAADRLASGRAAEHDHALLELAASLTALSRRIDLAKDAAQAVEDLDALSDTERNTSLDTLVGADTDADVPGIEADAPTSDGAPEAEPELAAAALVADVPATSVDPPAPLADVAALPPRLAPAPAPTRRRRRSPFTITPLGGAGEIGGSALLVRTDAGSSVLLDCGQRVKGEYGIDTAPRFHRRLGIDGRLHAILISHAHIDHVGSLPILHRDQLAAQNDPIPVYMSQPTWRLAEFMLEDSAKIQAYDEVSEAERGFLDYGRSSMEAAYRRSDVQTVLEAVECVEPGRIVPIPDTGLIARFLPVAHVLGSCAIHLTDTDTDQTLLYTGDLGPFTDPQSTLPQYTMAEMLAADVVIMESTYGRTESRDAVIAAEGKRRRGLSGREQGAQLLFDAARHAFEQGGSLLLPAFSLGRTQELAKIVQLGRGDGRLPSSGRIYVGGMGEKITEVYSDFSAKSTPWARAEDMPRTEQLGAMTRSGRSFEEIVHTIVEGEPSIIIASPAMLSGGWSRAFVKAMIEDPRHAIVLSGYLPQHSGGIPYLHRLRQHERVPIDGHHYKVNARLERAKGLSAHAPGTDLRAFAAYMARQADHVAFGMVHGDPAAQECLAEDVAEANSNASARSLTPADPWRPQLPS